MSHLTPPPLDLLAPNIRRGRYLFLDLARRGGLSAVYAGWEECQPNYVIDRPAFRFYSVELLATGSWEIRTRNQWKPAVGGTILTYGPKQRGGIRAAGEGPYFKYFVAFDGSEAPSTLDAASLRRRRHRRLADPQFVAGLFEQIVACASLRSSSREQLADLLLRSLLVRIGAESTAAGRDTSHAQTLFGRCRNYLVENYPQIHGIGDASLACHVAPAYLSRLFRKFSGQTATHFLARLRMDHAAKLLLSSDITVKAAGQAVGFDDPYHFSRVFKRIHGTSPRLFLGK
jgi:AraC-like DNA-binding protein